MKLTCLLMLLCVINTSSFGQNKLERPDTTVVETESRHPIVTNSFWNNWFASIAVGGSLYFGDHNKQAKVTELLNPNYAVHLGKWFTPGIGIRLGANGYQINGLTQGPHSTGEQYDGTSWQGHYLYKSKFNYYHIQAEALFNMSNLLRGYRENRFYHFTPHIGLGWIIKNDEPSAKEITANLGILQSFRLSNSLDLLLDFQGSLVNDRFDGTVGGRQFEGLLSGNIGIAYKFKKRSWERPSTVVVSYDQEVMDALRTKIKALSEDNDLLRKQLADANSRTITDVKIENNTIVAPILITFPINKSTVSKEARVNLGFLARAIKAGDSTLIYQITGYADKGTGSIADNQKLSLARAEAVRDILVEEFLVPKAQIELQAAGGVDNMYYDDPKLSRAVITLAK